MQKGHRHTGDFYAMFCYEMEWFVPDYEADLNFNDFFKSYGNPAH